METSVALAYHAALAQPLQRSLKLLLTQPRNRENATALSDRTGQEVHISPTDYICYACYKMYCSILDSQNIVYVSL